MSHISRLVVVVALAFGLSATVPVIASDNENSFKLEGAWVARVIGFPGLWSYVISSDPSGRTASGHGSVEVEFDANAVCNMYEFPVEFEPSDFGSPLLISIVKTGPTTGSYYSIFYGLRNLVPPSPIKTEIVSIGVATGELEFVAPGKMHGTHYFALYKPEADADGDGFPDEGVMPDCMFPLTTVDTRLPTPE